MDRDVKVLGRDINMLDDKRFTNEYLTNLKVFLKNEGAKFVTRLDKENNTNYMNYYKHTIIGFDCMYDFACVLSGFDYTYNKEKGKRVRIYKTMNKILISKAMVYANTILTNNMNFVLDCFYHEILHCYCWYTADDKTNKRNWSDRNKRFENMLGRYGVSSSMATPLKSRYDKKSLGFIGLVDYSVCNKCKYETYIDLYVPNKKVFETPCEKCKSSNVKYKVNLVDEKEI